MKTTVLLYIGVMITVFVVGIISVVTMKSSYAETIRDSLDDSIVYSVMMLQQDRDLLVYKDADGNESHVEKEEILWDESTTEDVEVFKRDFVGYLVSNLDNRITDLDVKIYGVDNNVGALSVEVIAHFNYPTGQADTVSSYKTVILNKYMK